MCGCDSWLTAWISRYLDDREIALQRHAGHYLRQFSPAHWATFVAAARGPEPSHPGYYECNQNHYDPGTGSYRGTPLPDQHVGIRRVVANVLFLLIHFLPQRGPGCRASKVGAHLAVSAVKPPLSP